MKSAELAVTLQRWLDSGEPQLTLHIDQQPVRLQRRPGGVSCCVGLSVAWRGGDAGLEAAMRLAGPSLGRFSAALALDPQERRLCLLRYLTFEGVTPIIAALEALANQREVWEAMLASPPAPIRQPLRSLSLGHRYV